MYILTIILFLLHSPPEVHTSLVEGPDAGKMCQQALPLTAKLYKQGKFFDGPDPKKIKKIRGMCQVVDDDTEIASI